MVEVIGKMINCPDEEKALLLQPNIAFWNPEVVLAANDDVWFDDGEAA